MLPEQVEKYFTSEEGLAELFKLCSEKFAIIDDYSNQLICGIMSTVVEYDKAREVVSGIKAYLNPILGEAITFRKNVGLKKYMELKTEWEKKPAEKDEKGKLVKEKFLDGATEKQADEFVSSYRRVRNALQYYVQSCVDIIDICNNRIYSLREEKKDTK